jgi:hypothetical protein
VNAVLDAALDGALDTADEGEVAEARLVGAARMAFQFGGQVDETGFVVDVAGQNWLFDSLNF